MSFDRVLARACSPRILTTLAAAAFVVSTGVAFAAPAGTGTGIIKDATGAGIPNVRLTLTRVSTNERTVIVSRPDGSFDFPSLSPDEYQLTAESTGFKRGRLEHIVVQVDQVARMDLTLETGDVAETVDVQALAPLVETESNTLVNVINQQTIQNMPLNSRNFTELALLTPGATPSAPGSQVTGFNVAGARTQSNFFLLDGIANMDIQINSSITTFRINDAVQEFSVQTSVPTAEFGRGMGAQVNAVLRSGSNSLHGAAFEYFRNTVLNATDYFAKHSAGGVKPILNRNQFGATLGGPVWKDHTFFFLSYEGFRQVAPTPTLVLVPTAAQRASVTDPVSQKLLAYFPLPLRAIDAGGTNFTSNVRNVLNDDTGLVKIDHQLGTKDHLLGHYAVYNGRTISGGPTPLTGGSSNTPKSFSASFEEDHTFSGSLLNSLRLGYSYNQTKFVVQDFGTNAASIITDTSGNALPGVVNATTNPQDSGIPTVTISGGFARLGSATNLPQGRNTNTYELIDIVSYTHGAHAMKFGVESRRDDARRYLDGTSRGSITFTNTASAAVPAVPPSPTNPTGTPAIPARTAAENSFIDFANGNVYTSTLRSGSTNAHYRRYPVYTFAQDTWKVTPTFTLDYGIRYELPGAIYERNGRGANLIPGQGLTLFGTNQVLGINTALAGPSSIIFTPGATTIGNNGVSVDYNNVAPIIGFAWSPTHWGSQTLETGTTVLRGGFRVGYDDIFNNIPANQTLNAPFNVTTTQTAGVTQVGKFSYATAFNQNVPLVKNVGKQGPGTPQVGLLAFNGVDPNIRSSYGYQYNLDLEQKLNRSMAFELQYIGSLGRKLGIFIDPNQPTVIVRNSALRGNQTPNEQVFPYNQYGSLSDSYGRNAVSSAYNGAVAVFRYRGPHATAFQASYTWSHSLDYGSNFFGSTGDAGYPSDSHNIKAEYGNSAFDERHRLVAYYSLPLPIGPDGAFLKSRNIVSREAFEGWVVSGITEVQSGLPFTAYLGATDYSGFNQFADKPNVGAGRLVQNNKNPDGAFATSYFTPIGAGQDGTERRNQYYGPGLVNFDLSAQKNFALSAERFKLQFRADLFNLFNHTNFSNPTSTYTSSSFGKITSTVGSATGGSGYAIGGVRLAQFSLRLVF
ncbi:MAG: carboxypeptidase regulatory-like domain-containing protein [Janthinobacterium lividum]